MQTSRRWFLIIPFCYLQRERNLPCSGQTGLCQDKRCIKLQQDRANRVRKDDVKDGLCTCLWKKKKRNKPSSSQLPSQHAVAFWTLCEWASLQWKVFHFAEANPGLGPSDGVNMNKFTPHHVLPEVRDIFPPVIWHLISAMKEQPRVFQQCEVSAVGTRFLKSSSSASLAGSAPWVVLSGAIGGWLFELHSQTSGH